MVCFVRCCVVPLGADEADRLGDHRLNNKIKVRDLVIEDLVKDLSDGVSLCALTIYCAVTLEDGD